MSATRTSPPHTTALQEAPAASEDRLVREHLALVHYAVAEVANRVPRHVGRDDLLSAAMLGLAQAARSWDAARGIAFDRFAMIRIRGALLDELRGRDWASRSVRARSRQLDAATDRVTAREGGTPSREAVAAELGISAAELTALHHDLHRATVLNIEAVALEGTIDDLLPDATDSPEEQLLARERTAYLIDAIVALPDRLRHVVVEYFFEERQMQDIAADLGVTESRVSQMRGEALALLTAGVTSQLEPGRLAGEPRSGRVASRKAAYYARVAAASSAGQRLDASPPSVQERVARLSA